MFGRRLIWLFSLAGFTVFALATGCAKPNYQDAKAQSVPNQGSSQNQDPGSDKARDPQSDRLLFSKGTIAGRIQWESLPSEGNFSSFVLEIVDLANDPTNLPPDLRLRVVLWMPSMGHGSSPVKIESLGRGLFHVTQVYFIMPGEWEMRLEIRSGEEAYDQATQKIAI